MTRMLFVKFSKIREMIFHMLIYSLNACSRSQVTHIMAETVTRCLLKFTRTGSQPSLPLEEEPLAFGILHPPVIRQEEMYSVWILRESLQEFVCYFPQRTCPASGPSLPLAIKGKL